MSKIYRKVLVSLAIAEASSNLNGKFKSDFIHDDQDKNKWRGGSRGKGGKTKWPRR